MDSPVEFEERFGANRVVYVITMDILRQVCEMVTKHRDLEKKYGLKGLPARHSEVIDDEISDLHIDRITSSQNIWTKKAQEHWEQSLLESQQRLSKMRKVTWTIADKDKFEGLVRNLRDLNDGLREILPPPRQRNLDRSLVITQSSRPEELDLLASVKAISGTYAAAALFKSQAIGQLKAIVSGTVLSSQDVKKLLIKPDIVISPENGSTRVLGRLRSGTSQKYVLVEHKRFEGDTAGLRETFKQRTLRLIQLLHISPKPIEYRVLDCQGYVQKETRNSEQWSLVFALPAELADRTQLNFSTLYDMLRDARTNAPPLEFSLGDRFLLASLLANSLSYIHAVGWLHRSLSSRNVICFSPDGKNEIKHPYLSGFEYARLDSNQEVSEVDQDSTSTLHCHPDYRQSSRRNKYRRSFEFYSLGILLIEIALWKRIEVFDDGTFEPHTFTRHLCRKVVPMLEYYMGSAYCDATLLCLDPSRFGLGDDEGERLSEAFSQRVVQPLDSCRA